MTPDAVDEIEDSFRDLLPIAETAADLFYDRLFTKNPEFQHMFPDDMHGQKERLVQALSMTVGALRRPDALFPLLHEMGARHVDYGVKDAHYHAVGAALLWALEASLAERFTRECRAAWSDAYALVASAMMEGAARKAKVA